MADIITETYRDSAVVKQLRQSFHAQAPRTLLLQQVICHDILHALTGVCSKARYRVIHEPLIRCCAEATVPAAVLRFLEDPAVHHLLSSIIGKPVLVRDLLLLKFSWKGYTVLNDTALEPPGIDFMIDLTPTWDQVWGGTCTYVDGTGGSLAITPGFGSVCIVERTQDLHRFIQYVNHYAGDRSRLLLVGHLV